MPYCYALQQWRAGLGFELERDVWQILAMLGPSMLVRSEITTVKVETTFFGIDVYSTTITRDGWFEDGGWRCQALVSLRQLRRFRASCFRDFLSNLDCKSRPCLCIDVSVPSSNP